MSATIVTTYTYPITDTPNDQVNTGTLADELNEAGLGVSVGNVNVAGSNIIIELLGDATSSDLALVDAVIAAHQGVEYSETPIFDYTTETAVDDDTGNEILAKTLESGPLHGGKYMVHWSWEVATTSAAAGEAKAWCSLQREGKTEYNKGEISNPTNKWQHTAVPFMFAAADGQNFFMRIYYQRTGTSGNAARLRRFRIAIKKVG